ncbi:hypothetical protein EVAR_25480_1 [Eumeta japonica]|uniref:Uncharacterized protein n=1 Tax=Eumeta variegata TaxID=151549 RepID=A0A4C1VKZ2_EUMVA|nr:hypothetical protein EVAR_25480_1 [Eumeta japonica]
MDTDMDEPFSNQTVFPHLSDANLKKAIFFLNQSVVATCAADSTVRVREVSGGGDAPLLVCSCHCGRVKRLATAPDNPHLMWSAGEDGLVLKVVDKKKKAWLDLLSTKANYRVQRKEILKDKLKYAENTCKDLKIRAKEFADYHVTATEYMIDDENESEITMDKIMKALKRMKGGNLPDMIQFGQKLRDAGDLEKAYDRLKRNDLWRILSVYGVSRGLMRALQLLYRGISACVKINGVTLIDLMSARISDRHV